MLRIVVVDGVTTEFTSSYEWSNIYGVTLIDAPMVMDLSFFIWLGLARISGETDDEWAPEEEEIENIGLSGSYTDLLIKSSSPSRNAISDDLNHVFDDIKNVIKGTMYFEEDRDRYIYQKSDGVIIDAFNTASGIKPFGLLQMLIKSKHIKEERLLILDDPDIYLPPKWQIEYAKFIAKLVAAGAPILVSSRSSYFLEALSFFSKEYQLQDKTRFYFGEKGKDSESSCFNDVTENLNPIFEKFTASFSDIFARD